MKTIVKLSIIAGILIFSLTSCFREPDYPNTPEVGFSSIRNFPRNNYDSIVVVISYKDGDGDLGLAQSDTMPPFQALLPNGEPNLFYNNYLIGIEKRVNGNYTPVQFTQPGFTLNGRFPRLNNLSSSAIEGTLQYRFNFFYIFSSAYTPPITRGDVVRFNIQIVDRALNKSNIVFSDDITIGQER
jgi:hypothetical protein